jgi:hypothetical protein
MNWTINKAKGAGPLEERLAPNTKGAIMATNGRITDSAEYGRHISLTCANHPDLRWSTKNISHIGARSIFFCQQAADERECDCPAKDLRVVEDRPR